MCDTLKTMGQQIDLFPPQQDVKLEATAEAMQSMDILSVRAWAG